MLPSGFPFIYNVSCTILSTERRGRVFNNPASYSEGPEFKSWPRLPAILIEVFRDFPQSLQVNAGIVN
jgi:hypothetical protein